MDSSTNTIELYFAEGSDTTLANLTALINAGVVEEYTSTVGGASYTGYKLVNQIVVNEGLEDALITTSKIANLAVDTDKLADLIITAGKIAAGQISWATHMAGEDGQPESYATDNRTAIPANVQLDGTGSALSVLDTAATNFNGRNDRDDTAVVVPTIAADGTAIDHVANTDGSADISFEWLWGGTEVDIDGFIIYMRNSKTDTGSYNFGTTPAEEQTWYIPADKRAFIFYGISINNYYTFGVQAYRVVDPDINAAEIIKSAVVQCSLAAEDPYRPATNATFAGNITGTLNGAAFGALASESVVTADFVGAGMIAVGTAAIATGAIATAHIGEAQITDAKIDRVSANKLVVVDADINSLSAGKITAGVFVSGMSITDSLSALNTSTGALTVDNWLTVGTGGGIKCGKTAYGSGTGIYEDYNAGNPRWDVGSDSEFIRFTVGSGVSIQGTVTVTNTGDFAPVNATANSSDATLLARANHTGTQTLSTVSDAGVIAALNSIGKTNLNSTLMSGGYLASNLVVANSMVAGTITTTEIYGVAHINGQQLNIYASGTSASIGSEGGTVSIAHGLGRRPIVTYNTQIYIFSNWVDSTNDIISMKVDNTYIYFTSHVSNTVRAVYQYI
jgi:hypothetical protein